MDEEEVYVLDGLEYPLADLQEAADADQMEVDEYISALGFEKKENGETDENDGGPGKSKGAQKEDATAAPSGTASTGEEDSTDSQDDRPFTYIFNSEGKRTKFYLDQQGTLAPPAEVDLGSDNTAQPMVVQDAQIKIEAQEKEEELENIINSPVLDPIRQDAAAKEKERALKLEKEAALKYENDKTAFNSYTDAIGGIDVLFSAEGEDIITKLVLGEDEYKDPGLNPNKIFNIDFNKELAPINSQIDELNKTIEESSKLVAELTEQDPEVYDDEYEDLEKQQEVLSNAKNRLEELENQRVEKIKRVYNQSLLSGDNYTFISERIADRALDLRTEDLDRISLTEEGSVPGRQVRVQYDNTLNIMEEAISPKFKTYVKADFWGYPDGSPSDQQEKQGFLSQTDELLGLIDGTNFEIQRYNDKYAVSHYDNGVPVYDENKMLDIYSNIPMKTQVLNLHKKNLEEVGYEFKDDEKDFQLFINPQTKEILKYKNNSPELEEFLESDLNAENSDEGGFINVDDNLDVLEMAGVIPTNQNEILEELTNKQFEIIYLAQELAKNLDDYRKDVSLGSTISNIFEDIFRSFGEENIARDKELSSRERASGVYRGNVSRDDFDLMELMQAAREGRLTHLPKEIESSPRLKVLVDLLNKKSNEFEVLSEAYTANFNPLQLEDDGFFDGTQEGAGEQFANPQMSTAEKRGIFYEWVMEKFPDTPFSKEEIDAIYNKTFLNRVGYGTPGFLAIMGEFALTRSFMGAAGWLKRIKGVGSIFNKTLFGTGKVGRYTEKYMIAFIEELAVLKARNVATGAAYDGDPLSLLFAFAAPAGVAFDTGMLKLINSGKIDKLMAAMSYVPTSVQRIGREVVGKPVTGATVMTVGEVPIGMYDVITEAPDPENPDQTYTWKTFAGHIFDPVAFAEKAALCFVTKNAVPIKVARDTYRDLVRDVNAITSGKRYRQHINRSLKDLGITREEAKGTYEENIKRAANEKYHQLGIGPKFLKNLQTLEISNKELNSVNNITDLINLAKNKSKGSKSENEAIRNLENFRESKRTIEELRELLKIKDAEQSLLLDFEYENFKLLNEQDTSGDIQDQQIRVLIGKAKAGGGLNPETIRTLHELNSPSLVRKILEDAGVDPSIVNEYAGMTEVSNYLMNKGKQQAIEFDTPDGRKYLDNVSKILELQATVNRMQNEKNETLKNQYKQDIDLAKKRIEEIELQQAKIISDAKRKAEEKAEENLQRTIENRKAKGVGEVFKVEGQQEFRDKLTELKDNNQLSEKEYDRIINNMDKGTVYDALNITIDRGNGTELILLADAKLIKESFETGKGPHEDEHIFTNHMFEELGIKGNEAKEKEFIQQFLNTFTEAQRQKILDGGLAKHPDYKNNPYTKEWFNYYVEALIKGNIKMDGKANEAQIDLFEDLVRDTFGVDIEIDGAAYRRIIENRAKSYLEGGSYGDLSKVVPNPTKQQVTTGSNLGADVSMQVNESAKRDLVKENERLSLEIQRLQADARRQPEYADQINKEIKEKQAIIDNNLNNLEFARKNDEAVKVVQGGKSDLYDNPSEAFNHLKRNKYVTNFKKNIKQYIEDSPSTQFMSDSQVEDIIRDAWQEIDYELLTWVNNWRPGEAPFGSYVQGIGISKGDVLENIGFETQFLERGESGETKMGGMEASGTPEVRELRQPETDRLTADAEFNIKNDVVRLVRKRKDQLTEKELKDTIGNSADKISKKLQEGEGTAKENYIENLKKVYKEVTELAEAENEWFRLRNWRAFYTESYKTASGAAGRSGTKQKQDIQYDVKIPTEEEWVNMMTFQGEYATNPKTNEPYTQTQINNKTSQRRLLLAKLLANQRAKRVIKEAVDNRGVVDIEMPNGETITIDMLAEDFGLTPLSEQERIDVINNLENQNVLMDAAKNVNAFVTEYTVDPSAYETVTNEVARDVLRELEEQGLEPREFNNFVRERYKAIEEDRYEEWLEEGNNSVFDQILVDNMRAQVDKEETSADDNFKKGLDRMEAEGTITPELSADLKKSTTPTDKYNKKNKTMDVDKLEEEQRLAFELQKFFPKDTSIMSGGEADNMSGQVTYSGYGVQGLKDLKTGEKLDRIQTTQQKFGRDHFGTKETSQWDGVTTVKGAATEATVADQVMFGTKKVRIKDVNGDPITVKIVDPNLASFEARQKIAQEKLTPEAQANKRKFQEALRESERLFLEEGRQISNKEYLARLKYLSAKKQYGTSSRDAERKLAEVTAIAIPKNPYKQETFEYTDPDGNTYEIVIPESKSKEGGQLNVTYTNAFGKPIKNSVVNMTEKTKVEHAITQLSHGINDVENLITGDNNELPSSAIYARRSDLDAVDASYSPQGKSLKLNRDPSGSMDVAATINEVYTTESDYTKTVKDEIIDKVVNETGLSESQVVKNLNDQSKGLVLDLSLNEKADQGDIDVAAGFIENYLDNKKEYDQAEKTNTDNAPEPFEDVMQDSATNGAVGQKNTAKLLDNTRDKLNHPKDEVQASYMYDMDGVIVGSSGERTIARLPDGTELRLNNEEYMKQYKDLKAKGAEFDYSEFTKLEDWLPGPKYEEFKKLIDEGKGDQVYIVTARAGAEDAIWKAFKDAGIEIPKENIKCCGGDEGKMLVYCERIAAGDNELHMSDDKWENIESFDYVVDQCPWVVGKGTWVNENGEVDPWAKPPITSTVDASGTNTYETPAYGWEIYREQERLLDGTFGKDRPKKISRSDARSIGADKNTFKITPYSGRHAINLTNRVYGKGQNGKNSIAFYEKYFYEPYNKAMLDLASMRVSMSNDYTALKKQNKDLDLNKEAFSGYSREDVVRMAMWKDQGVNIPGVGDGTLRDAQEYLKNDPDLKLFKYKVEALNKVGEIAPPEEIWKNSEGGSLGADLDRAIDTKGRERVLARWNENKDILFSEERLNEMEAQLGPKWRRSMENTIKRMETGKSDDNIKDPYVKAAIKWLNGATAAALFFNRKSGTLQMLSFFNYFNASDNNPIAAAAAMANVPKYIKEVNSILKSDYLKNRIKNREMGVAEGEFAKDPNKFDKSWKSLTQILGDANLLKTPQKFIQKVIDAGFSITSAMDAFAIATGGATFVINRTKTYEKQGMSYEDAHAKAFEDFRALSEKTQQSYDMTNLADQQVAGYSRVVLNFLNTTMLYNNRMIEAASNIKNNRGSKEDVFALANYGIMQPMLFAMAKDALLWLLMDDEIPKDAKEAEVKKKTIEALYATLYNLANGTGVTGKIVTTIAGMVETGVESQEKWNKNLGDVGAEALAFATSIDMKIAKMESAGYAAERAIKKDEGFLGENSLEAGTKIITAVTNFAAPEYILKSIEELELIVDERTSVVQKLALALGWSEHSLEIQGDIGKAQGLPQNYNKAIKYTKAVNNQNFNSGFSGSSSPDFSDGWD